MQCVAWPRPRWAQCLRSHPLALSSPFRNSKKELNDIRFEFTPGRGMCGERMRTKCAQMWTENERAANLFLFPLTRHRWWSFPGAVLRGSRQWARCGYRYLLFLPPPTPLFLLLFLITFVYSALASDICVVWRFVYSPVAANLQRIVDDPATYKVLTFKLVSLPWLMDDNPTGGGGGAINRLLIKNAKRARGCGDMCKET